MGKIGCGGQKNSKSENWWKTLKSTKNYFFKNYRKIV